MNKINKIEYFDRTDYNEAKENFINGLNQEFIKRDSFFQLVDYVYKAGLKYDTSYFEDKEYLEILDRLSYDGFEEYVTYDSWFNFIWTVFQIGIEDSIFNVELFNGNDLVVNY